MPDKDAFDRRPMAAANWKMFKTAAETAEFFEKFMPLVADVKHCDIVVAPPFPAITTAVEAARDTSIQIAGQNIYWEQEGAYTGEVSGRMLKAAGCSHVIIGHSERRHYFGETDETVHKKIIAALEADLIPIVCLGETLEQRQAEETEAVLIQQFDGATAALTGSTFSPIIIAYEPVWAIGTGKTATPEAAGAAHQLIRNQAEERFGKPAAQALRILYGGSAKPDNVLQLAAQPQVDGGLVGGASLTPQSFAAVINYLDSMLAMVREMQ